MGVGRLWFDLVVLWGSGAGKDEPKLVPPGDCGFCCGLMGSGNVYGSLELRHSIGSVPCWLGGSLTLQVCRT